MTELSAGTAIAYRDLLKFLRDPIRIASTFIFPVIFVVVLGGSLAGLDEDLGMDMKTFVFLGVLGQTIFQSAAMGIVSLIEDRENDFSQAIFVAPISRYTIVLGKIGGESLVAIAQAVAIMLFGVLIGVRIPFDRLGPLAAATVVAALFGGTFGLIVMSNLGSQRAANQVFPFLMLPQFFLAGVFTPANNLPVYLDIASRLSPMRYAVDLIRGAYIELPHERVEAVLTSIERNLWIIGILSAVFLLIGTRTFVRKEQNR